MSKPEFPAPTGEHDDDLPPAQEMRLSAGADAARFMHIDKAKTASTTGIVTLKTWECPTHKLVVIQGDPCPECGKKLLLD